MTDPHKMFQKKLATLTIKIKVAHQKANEHDDGSRAFAESIVKTSEKYENQLDSLSDTFVDIDMNVDDTRLFEEVMGSILTLKHEYETKMQNRTSSMSNCNLVPSTSTSTCEQVKKDVHSKPGEQKLQDFDPNFKEPSKSKGLRKMVKKLQSLTLITLGSKTPITKLREMLTEIDQIKPDEVRQLIDLTIVKQLLTNEDDEHQLTNDDRSIIGVCLLESAKTVARQIVEDCKQDNASLFTYFKQLQFLHRTVKAFKGIAKMKTADLEQYKNHCQSYRDMCTLGFIKQNPNVYNAEMMDYYVQMLDEFLQKCRIGLDLQIALLKYMELEQSTAQNVNEDQAINMPIKNFFGLFKSAIDGLFLGANWMAQKSIEKRKEVVRQMEEQYESMKKWRVEAVELKQNPVSVDDQINESNNEPNGQTTDSANEAFLDTSFLWVNVIDESVTVEAVPDDQSAQDGASQPSKSKYPDHESNIQNAASQLIEAIELKESLDSENDQNQPNGQTCESLIEASLKVSVTLDDVTDVTVETVPDDQLTQDGASQPSKSKYPDHESNIQNAASQLIEAIELKESLDSENDQNQPNGQTCESLIEASLKVSVTLDDVTDVTVETVPDDQSTQDGASQASKSKDHDHESNTQNAETVSLPRFVVRPNGVIHRSNWSYSKK